MLGALECIPEKGAPMTGFRGPGSSGDAGRVTGRRNSIRAKALGENRAWVLWKQREASSLEDTYRLRLVMLACWPSWDLCLVSHRSGSGGDMIPVQLCVF